MSDKSRIMNRRSVLRGVVAGAVASPALVGSANAQTKVTWRVQSHWPKATSSFDQSLRVFGEEVSKATDGAFKLELLGAGEFAGASEIFNIVRKGVVPMGTASPSYYIDQADTVSLFFGVPGTLRTSWEMQHLIKNKGIEDLVNQDLAAKGVMVMAEKIIPTELVLSKQINSVDDLRGLKIRSSGSMLDFLQTAGAAPQYVAGTELYQALSSGVVDGAHYGAAIGAQSLSLWEVCKHHYRPSLNQATESFLLNTDAVEALDDDMRDALLNTIEKRFFLRSVEYQEQEAVALREGISEDGVILTQWPEDVMDLLSKVSMQTLEKVADKSERAATGADIYRELMTNLGYI